MAIAARGARAYAAPSTTLGFPMQTLLYYSTTIAVLAVFVVLLLGLRSMLKGTSPNTSQKLMRWRVGLQFGAVVLIVAYALLLR